MSEMKRCSTCKQELPADRIHFHSAGDRNGRLRSSCKECEKIKHAKSKPYKPVAKKDHRICTACGIEFPETIEYFQLRARSDKFRSLCKGCISKQKAKNYQNNQEKFIVRSKMYYSEHKDRMRNWGREYYYRNKERITIQRIEKREIYLNRSRLWREANKEYIVKKGKEYYDSHKESISKTAKIYRMKNEKIIAFKRRMKFEENPELYLSKRRAYFIENREKIRFYHHGRRVRIRELPSTLTISQWDSIKLSFDNKCCYCGESKPLAQEHFLPVIRDGEYSHNNILCACQSCNSSKGTKSFFEWYPKFKHYSKRRERKILTFLHYEKDTHIQQLALL